MRLEVKRAWYHPFYWKSSPRWKWSYWVVRPFAADGPSLRLWLPRRSQVFLGDREHGWGQHAENPEDAGKCYCHALYGERGHQQFLAVKNSSFHHPIVSVLAVFVVLFWNSWQQWFRGLEGFRQSVRNPTTVMFSAHWSPPNELEQKRMSPCNSLTNAILAHRFQIFP